VLFHQKSTFFYPMAEKRRFNASLPDHIADEIERYAKQLSATPTEYAALIIKDWYARGCPAVTADEERLRQTLEKSPKRTMALSPSSRRQTKNYAS
jgi:hypothetical protein